MTAAAPQTPLAGRDPAVVTAGGDALPEASQLSKPFTSPFWVCTLPSLRPLAPSSLPGGSAGRPALLAGRCWRQCCRWCPRGRVPCLPDPVKHNLGLCWVLGSPLGGRVLPSILEEDFPQALFSSGSLLSVRSRRRRLDAGSVSEEILVSGLSRSAVSWAVGVFFLPSAV